MARASLLNRSGRHGHTSDLRAVLSFIIERALVLLDELDCDPDGSRACAGLWSALGTIRTGRARTTTVSPTAAGMLGCAAGRTRYHPSASRHGGACEAADVDRSGQQSTPKHRSESHSGASHSRAVRR